MWPAQPNIRFSWTISLAIKKVSRLSYYLYWTSKRFAVSSWPGAQRAVAFRIHWLRKLVKTKGNTSFDTQLLVAQILPLQISAPLSIISLKREDSLVRLLDYILAGFFQKTIEKPLTIFHLVLSKFRELYFATFQAAYNTNWSVLHIFKEETGAVKIEKNLIV